MQLKCVSYKASYIGFSSDFPPDEMCNNNRLSIYTQITRIHLSQVETSQTHGFLYWLVAMC